MESPTSFHDKTIGLSVKPGLPDVVKRWPTSIQKRVFLVVLAVVDILMLSLAARIAYGIRFESALPFFYYGATNVSQQTYYYIGLSCIAVGAWLFLFWLHRLYDWHSLLGGIREYVEVFRASITGVVLLTFCEFFFEQFVVARGWVSLFGILSFVFVCAGRFGLRRVAYAARRRGYLISPAIIIGANEEGRAIGEQLASWPTSGLSPVGYVDDQKAIGSLICRGLSIVGSLSQLDEVVSKYHVDEFVIAGSALSRNDLLTLFQRYGISSDVNFRISSGLFELIATGLDVREIAYVPLIRVNHVKLTGAELMFKVVLEYSLTAAALVLLAPLMIVIALLIWLDSLGEPVLYRRRVVGLNGKLFDAYKFRTMHVKGDDLLKASPELLDELATKHKIIGDPRITQIGQFLRKYSLDELPQLLNVLRGEMSLVGPRIISPPELKNYGPFATNLLTVRPGITGLWQVSGRSDLSYEERVRLDMFYIRNYSIWLDLHLIGRTIPVVLSGKGAY